jgi:hypothetical protein
MSPLCTALPSITQHSLQQHCQCCRTARKRAGGTQCTGSTQSGCLHVQGGSELLTEWLPPCSGRKRATDRVAASMFREEASYWQSGCLHVQGGSELLAEWLPPCSGRKRATDRVAPCSGRKRATNLPCRLIVMLLTAAYCHALKKLGARGTSRKVVGSIPLCLMFLSLQANAV